MGLQAERTPRQASGYPLCFSPVLLDFITCRILREDLTPSPEHTGQLLVDPHGPVANDREEGCTLSPSISGNPSALTRSTPGSQPTSLLQ